MMHTHVHVHAFIYVQHTHTHTCVHVCLYVCASHTYMCAFRACFLWIDLCSFLPVFPSSPFVPSVPTSDNKSAGSDLADNGQEDNIVDRELEDGTASSSLLFCHRHYATNMYTKIGE